MPIVTKSRRQRNRAEFGCKACGGTLVRLRSSVGWKVIAIPVGFISLFMAVMATFPTVAPAYYLWWMVETHKSQFDAVDLPVQARWTLAESGAVSEAEFRNFNDRQRSAVVAFRADIMSPPWIVRALRFGEGQDFQEGDQGNKSEVHRASALAARALLSWVVFVLVIFIDRAIARVQCVSCGAEGRLQKAARMLGKIPRSQLSNLREQADKEVVKARTIRAQRKERVQKCRAWRGAMNTARDLLLLDLGAGTKFRTIDNAAACANMKPGDLRDRRLVEWLYGRHEFHRRHSGNWDENVSGHVAKYLYGYFQDHRKNRNRKFPDVIGSAQEHVSILPIRDLALTIQFEACGRDLGRFRNEFFLAYVERVFPEEIDWESDPIKKVITGEWTSADRIQEYLTTLEVGGS